VEINEALKGRRSINYFDPGRSIPDEKLRELIEIANLSPSSFNLQPWEVVVVTDAERKEILKKCAFEQEKVVEASAVLIIIANPNAIEENIDRVLENWADLGYMKREETKQRRAGPFKLHGDAGSEKRKLFAVKNTSFFAMALMIAARAQGLETHPMDGFSEEMVKGKFNIPDDRVIPLLIAVGYLKPGVKLLPRAFRRGLDEFVTFNGS
jgi:putative NAD(P)H nitroreductase